MEITIRPALPSDAEALERFYADLSEDSRHLRFFGGTRGISHRQSLSFCTPDHAHREGFVAVASSGGPEPDLIVGHVCLEPVNDTTAEVAIAVADAYQRRGIGRRLMTAGIDWARSVQITRLNATMLATNSPIQRLLANLGLAVSANVDDLGMASVGIDLTSPMLAAA
jgi:acetyltransferase